MPREEKRIDNNRIVYVEPNHIHGTYGSDGNNVYMTPDYSDMTIWCNLVVEKSSRLKNQASGTDETETYYINYDLTKVSNGSDYVSFLQGKDVDNYNYLTTSYTDFDFNEIRRKNMVEGLQIESIKVSMQNYTCPHVTIRFIDVRGAGFFGREETTHNEYGNLTNLAMDNTGQYSDNFYNCFVSFPYPRFKLQIKGFYGHPITLQLTCSNFEGNFNSQTGNFELNVQFIGYEYGVLADIPFDYIVAAPLTKIGGDYWNEQIEIAQTNNSNHWLLGPNDTQLPVKLYDFYNNIKAEIEQYKDDDINEFIASDSVMSNLSDGDEQLRLLDSIVENITRFKKKLKDTYGLGYVTQLTTDTEEYIIIHSEKNVVRITKDVAECYNALSDSIDAYAEKYKGTEIDSSMVPNGPSDGYWKPWKVSECKLSEFSSWRKGGYEIGDNIIVARNGSQVSGARITNAQSCFGVHIPYFNDNDNEVSVTRALSEEIFKNYTHWDWCVNGNNYARYAGIIDFKGITAKLGERINLLKVQMDEYRNMIDGGPTSTIEQLIGFAPYIGNYFKVVMCHLETFIYLFKNTADAIQGEINEGLRTPANLGIRNVNYQTDVPSALIGSNKQIPHFPSVYKKYSVEEDILNNLPDSKDILASAWIGDFNGPYEWQERVLVDELFFALQHIDESRHNKETTAVSRHSKKTPSHFSLFAQDVFKNTPIYASANKENLALYIGLRAQSIFGIYNYGNEIKDDYASKFGAIDAVNLINQCTNKTSLADLVKVNSEGQTLADELLNMTINNKSGQSNPYAFEFVRVTDGRQPIFKKEGDSKLKYVYMPCNKLLSIVPVDNFNSITAKNFSEKYTWENKNFKVKDYKNSDYLFTDCFDNFLNYNEKDINSETREEILRKTRAYTNNNMFNIFNEYSGSFVDTGFECDELLMAYDKFSKGNEKVGSISGDKFVEVTNEYWLMDNYCLDYFYKKYSNESYIKSGIDDSKLVTFDGTIGSNLLNINNANDTEKFINEFMSKLGQ